jgi:hypothetical protein
VQRQNTQTIGCEFGCSRRITYSCSTIGTGRSIHVKNSMINQERTMKGGIDLFENLEPSIYDSPEM